MHRDYLNFSLAHTQIKVVIPIRNYVMNVSALNNPIFGVIPAFEVTNSFQDILQGKDSEMNFVIIF